MNRTIFDLSCSVLMFCALCAATSAQSNPKPTPAPAPTAAQEVPVIDGGAGPCSVDFTVTTADGKPAGAATVRVHIASGFGGFHKLDLQAGTNSDGKVKFTGLPSRVRRSLLEFEAFCQPKLSRSCFARPSAMNFMSSFVPNLRQPVGHALMHAGSSPSPTRSEQSVHL